MKGAIKQLGEICRFEYGSSLPAEKREEGPHPVFGSNGLVGMHSSPVTDGPTIIVGRKGSAGSVNYSEVSCFPIDTTYFIDRTTAKCDLKWLFYALNNLGLNRLNQAAAVPGLNRNLAYIQSLFVPECPDDQKRIAAILDKADAIRRKRQQALRLTDDFLRSVFLDMFGDPVSNSKGFQRGTIRDLVDSANYGTSEKAHLTDGEYPVLRMNNLTYAGGWDFSSLKYVDLDQSSVHKYLVNNGQMLFNRTNSKELVGKTAVYRRDFPMAYAGYLVRATAKPDADSEYISAYLNSKHGKAILFGMCKSIVGMANINAQEMLSIPILLPPEELQKRFGDIVRLVEARRESQHQAIEASGTLFASLQQRAFSGQL